MNIDPLHVVPKHCTYLLHLVCQAGIKKRENAVEAAEGYDWDHGATYELLAISELPRGLDGMMYLYNTPRKLLILLTILFGMRLKSLA